MPTTRTKRAPEAEPTEPAPKRIRKPKAVEPEVVAKPARGPRGEHLERHGVAITKGALKGYVVALSFTEFELAKHPDRAGWVVVCRLHGTASEPFAAKALAEKAGARAARATWCGECEPGC